ncbi:lateral signaling target protein 2 homolog [Amia ocellicauda]|uniref:lateral signaling target protein 2 homolog n=1 Tax=Amia ocellicauda TaxID=2972642 RepID=UPI0034640CA1|nr:LST2 protein [Amia calva]
MLSAIMRRWFCRPKKSDRHPLAQFYYADEEVNRVTAELNGVDLRKDPQKYLVLLSQLRMSQDRMLRAIELVMEDCISAQRQSRDYHVKFPDEILHENLGVQLWFAAECLSVGSFLEVREAEGLLLRPLAEQLLQCLEHARLQLREQSLNAPHSYSPELRQALLQYDRVFSQFELSYISTVIPLKSAEELQRQQEIVVLFCETVERALKLGYLNQELIDGYEPLVMFTIPRLAIICGLLIFPDGPLNLQQGPEGMSSLFSPFYSLLQKIRDLLRILTQEELHFLERSLCAAESSGFLCAAPSDGGRSSFPSSLPPVDYEPGCEVPGHTSLQPPSHVFPGHPCFSSTTESQYGNTGIWPSHPYCQEGAADHRQPPVSPDKPDSAFYGAACSLHSPAFQEQGQPCQLVQSERQPQHGPALVPSSDLQPHVCLSGQGSGEQGRCDADSSAPVTDRFYYFRSPVDRSRAGAGAGTGTEGEGRERRWRHSVMAHSWYSGQPLPTAPSRPAFRERRFDRVSENGTGTRGPVDHATRRVRTELRARYSSSGDMIHRLFVCISGVADQLQTNFASDMRAILKCVFELIISRDETWDRARTNSAGEDGEREQEEDSSPGPVECELCEDLNTGVADMGNIGGPPVWVPDSACNHCTACQAPFTLLRRRHHCRSCGKIFCSRCSPHEAPLPRFGQMKPVRVCNHCFNFHIVGETTPL